MKVVIIGNGAAGFSAAENLIKSGEKVSVTVVTDEIHPPYLRCILPDILVGDSKFSQIV